MCKFCHVIHILGLKGTQGEMGRPGTPGPKGLDGINGEPGAIGMFLTTFKKLFVQFSFKSCTERQDYKNNGREVFMQIFFWNLTI